MPQYSHVNRWYTTLNGAVADTDATITVDAAPDWADGDPPFFAMLCDSDSPLATVEYIVVTGRTGLVLDVLRGQDGSTAENWADASLVRSDIRRQSLDRLAEAVAVDGIGYAIPVLWASNGAAPTWAATTAYAVGDTVVSTTFSPIEEVFRCIKAGTSGGTEPDWTTPPLTDGTVEWDYITYWDTGATREFGDVYQPDPPTGYSYTAQNPGRSGQLQPIWGAVNEVTDPIKVAIFETTGTWQPEPRGASTRIICVGGGGGGGAGRKGAAGTARVGGGGGGGAGYSDETFNTTDLGDTPLDVVVGAGGAGAAAQTTNSTDGANGTAGGASYVGPSATDALIHAAGGAAGVGGGSGAGGTGGAGGVGSHPGGAGDTADGAGGAGGAGARQTQRAPGGAAGGGISTANAASAGGTGNRGSSHSVTGATAGAVGVGGGDGTNPRGVPHSPAPGSSGAGGGASTAGNAGAGGDGARGAGGGGGGAAVDAVGNSGAGGPGGPGLVIIITA